MQTVEEFNLYIASLCKRHEIMRAHKAPDFHRSA